MAEKVQNASATFWIVKEWYVWPFAWVLAGGNYVRNIDELLSRVITKLHQVQRQAFDEIHILSHGNRHYNAEGKVIGHYINMGGNDRLDTGDFDSFQNPIAGTDTQKFLALLSSRISVGGRLIFSACGQGDGALFANISRCIGNRVTVSGYSKLGHPFGNGNIAFRNGFRLKL